MCVCVCRSEPAGGHREWSDAVRSQRSGESLSSDQPTALPADGCPGGTQCPGHYIRYLYTHISLSIAVENLTNIMHLAPYLNFNHQNYLVNPNHYPQY